MNYRLMPDKRNKQGSYVIHKLTLDKRNRQGCLCESQVDARQKK